MHIGCDHNLCIAYLQRDPILRWNRPANRPAPYPVQVRRSCNSEIHFLPPLIPCCAAATSLAPSVISIIYANPSGQVRLTGLDMGALRHSLMKTVKWTDGIQLFWSAACPVVQGRYFILYVEFPKKLDEGMGRGRFELLAGHPSPRSLTVLDTSNNFVTDIRKMTVLCITSMLYFYKTPMQGQY